MSRFTDRAYLRHQQYKDASNLDARVRLHRLFSTSPQSWHRWVFAQLDLPDRCDLLELGCGPGDLWVENQERIAPGWAVVVSDLSAGMARQAAQALDPRRGRFACAVVDAQTIPFAARSFDAVIANHMLYHVPDTAQTIAEIHRVLRPGGRLFAATNGRTHMQEIRALVARFSRETGLSGREDDWLHGPERFSLETGGAQLVPPFAHVQVKRFPDSLIVTDVEPLAAYVLSSIGSEVAQDRTQELNRFLEREIAATGAIRIEKDSGLFEAVRGPAE